MILRRMPWLHSSLDIPFGEMDPVTAKWPAPEEVGHFVCTGARFIRRNKWEKCKEN